MSPPVAECLIWLPYLWSIRARAAFQRKCCRMAKLILTGPAPSGAALRVNGFVTGPTNFGSGDSQIVASSGSGDLVGITGVGALGGTLALPKNYVSGAALSDTSTYDNATFASLGVTPGTYTWTWGTGATADSFALQVGPAAMPVPEPG